MAESPVTPKEAGDGVQATQAGEGVQATQAGEGVQATQAGVRTTTAGPSSAKAPEEVAGTPEHRGAHAHPTEKDYIKIALILALITLIEVAVYYVPSLEGLLVPILIFCSAVKFVMVVMWFMHLRFDSRLFRRLFVTGLLLAFFCFIIVLSTFHVWTR